MTTPVRVQRKRTAGWRMPANTKYVGRGSAMGNPHKVGVSLCENGDGRLRRMTPADAVAAYERDLPYWVESGMKPAPSTLKGQNLACWCPLDQPCHADVLLKLANKP